MSTQDPTEHFIRSLTECQNRLYGYIFSLLGNHHAAADVLQECNLVLWRKVSEFRVGSEFIPWAFGIARFQVLAHLRDEKRKHARFVDSDLVELLHEEAAEQAGQFDHMQEALRHCVTRLAPGSRELIESRYRRNLPLQAIADATQRNLSAVKVALMRVRLALRECIERQMGKADAL
jgi:RNA polymerase sigma-70 factor, ECF subfamily